MKLYEYEAKKIFSEYGIKVPRGKVVSTVEDLKDIDFFPIALKAQVLHGSRGKAGLIKFANNYNEALENFKELKKFCEKILVEEKINIDKELYLSIIVDRSIGKPLVVASGEGGVDIEEVEEEKIIKKHIDIFTGLKPYEAREIARKICNNNEIFKKVSDVIYKLYRLFRERDCYLAEINPLAISGNDVIALDAKLIVDEDAYYRQNFERKEELAYVELDGNVGCIVNGAGLAMATLDTLKHFGLEPANFLDIGGGADEKVMKRALKLVAGNDKTKLIFINILGGITRCDEVAKGIVSALNEIKKELKVEKPIIVRLIGTNEEEGRKILENYGIYVFSDMIEAVKKAKEVFK